MYFTELVAVDELCIYIALSSTDTCTRASVSASSKMESIGTLHA